MIIKLELFMRKLILVSSEIVDVFYTINLRVVQNSINALFYNTIFKHLTNNMIKECENSIIEQIIYLKMYNSLYQYYS